MKKYLTYLVTLVMLSTYSYAQTAPSKNTSDAPSKWNISQKFKKGDFTIGVYLAAGYNIISTVDGTLNTIPNKPDPSVKPGYPVTASLLSVNVQVPSLAMEYWYLDTFSVRAEAGIDAIILGSDHMLSDFAYILAYFKMVLGTRMYFDDIFFAGVGLFANIPIAKPLIGFMQADTGTNFTFGPYIELGVNYALTKTVALEASARFSFSVLPYTEKTNKAILATLNSSPLDIGIGFNYKLA